MARPGVTYAEVAEAATHLIGAGKNPTIEQIRLFLGTGSSTTIANHLKQWKATQQNTQLLAAKENIPQELVAILKGLWEQVIEQAEAKVGVIEAKAQSAIDAMQEELLKYKNNNQRWQQLFKQWQLEKDQLTQEKSAFETEITTINKENNELQTHQDVLNQSLQEKQERITELHRLHKQAQSNLEHYRETSREERIKEQHQFEQQKQTLQHEVKTLEDQVIKVKESNRSIEMQFSTLKQAYASLEAEERNSHHQLEQLQKEILALTKHKIESENSLQHLEKNIVELKIELAAKTNQLIESHSITKTQSKELKTLHQTIADLTDQHKSIGHERWILSQEKAQLEGQLKQMQSMMKI